MGQRNYNFDAAMQLKDAGLVAASAAAQVDGVAQVIDLGGGNKIGRLEGTVVIDVSAVEIDSNDENYLVILEGSIDGTFTDDVQNLAAMDFGAKEVRKGNNSTDHIDSVAGRYEMYFCNEQGDLTYRYLRLYTVVAGTIATGINYAAFIAPLPDN